jgi:NAD(P)-dependent dehydrogenase (short-subunit alcohol dehydrogenase family)
MRFEEDGKSGPAAIVSLSKMNGDFGFGGGSENFIGGGFTGLLKAVRREYPEMLIKALDFSATADVETIGDAFIAELSSGDTELEVGFSGRQRMVVSAEPVPASAPVQVSSGGVWVVSGGGRGVTYVVAHELAKRFGLRLHLIGTAALGDENAAWRGLDEVGLKQLKKQVAIEARRAGKSPASEWSCFEKQRELEANLDALTNDGIDATYHICDISDRNALAMTLDKIRGQDGAINGVIHGAGVESACRLTRKKPELVRRTLSSKCVGAANLMELTKRDSLEHFVAFGSTSGRFGGLGQADYSLASDLLAKMTGAFAKERPQTRCVCFHWPAWDDVGMAVRPESRMALERGGLKFMPSREGVEHLIGELTAASSDHEVLILDGPGMLDTDGTLVRSVASEPVTTFGVAPEQLPNRDADIETKSSDCGTPLVEPVRRIAENQYEAIVRLDPTRDVFLKDHRLREKPFLAAVVTMELFARAVQQIQPESDIVGMSQVSVGNGLRLTETDPFQCKIRVQKIGDDFRCELVGPRPGQNVESNPFIYSTAVLHCGQASVADPVDVGEPVFGWTPFIYPPDSYILHGPSFQTLLTLDFQHGGGRGNVLGTAQQDLFSGREGTAIVPAAALDGCLFLCGIFGYAMLEKVETLPYGIDSYRQYGRPRAGEICSVRIYYRESNDIGPVFDFTLVGESNDVILKVEGFQTACIRDGK